METYKEVIGTQTTLSELDSMFNGNLNGNFDIKRDFMHSENEGSCDMEIEGENVNFTFKVLEVNGWNSLIEILDAEIV